MDDCVRECAAAQLLYGAPTEFEMVTALGFLYFKECGCEIAVVEAGLGGLLDATNVLSRTEVAVLTRIGLDHTAVLGGTLREIARQKCGIIKPGCTVVSVPGQRPEAAEEIRAAAGTLGCPLLLPGYAAAPLRPQEGVCSAAETQGGTAAHAAGSPAMSIPKSGAAQHAEEVRDGRTTVQDEAVASPCDGDTAPICGEVTALPHGGYTVPRDGEGESLPYGGCRAPAGAAVRAADVACATDPFGGAAILELGLHGCRFRFAGREYRTGYGPELLPVVVAAITAAEAAGATEEAICRAVREVKLPMRQELFCRGADLLLLDGGHNPDAMGALCARLDREAAGRRIVAVCGMLRDKDWGRCVELLARRCARFVATEPASPRRAAAGEIAAEAATSCDVVLTEPEIGDALRAAGLIGTRADDRCAGEDATCAEGTAKGECGPLGCAHCGGCGGASRPAGRLAVVCGSFYLCGEARRLLLAAGWTVDGGFFQPDAGK